MRTAQIFLFALIIFSVGNQSLPTSAKTRDYSPREDVKNPPLRVVKGQVLTSAAFPSIQLRISRKFRYLGKFSFTVPNMSKGERYIFAELQGRGVKKLFIAQFEGILPDSPQTYNYNFADALTVGAYKFKQNTFAFNARDSLKKDPPDEGSLTTQFLSKHRYITEDEMMAARLVNVPDAERKHELILFYMENISDSGHRLQDFYSGEERTPIWRDISRDLARRLIDSFTIIK